MSRHGVTSRSWLDRGRRALGVVGALGVLGFGIALAAPVVGAWNYTVGTVTYSATGTPSNGNAGTKSSDILAGQYAYDTAKLNETDNRSVLAGSVTFYLYPASTKFSSDCYGGGGSQAVLGDSGLTPVFTSGAVTVAATASGVSTEGVSSLAGTPGYFQVPPATTAGTTYYWIAKYNFKDRSAAKVDYSSCMSEGLWVTAPPAPAPTISSTPNPTAASEGQALTDSAAVNNPTDAWPANESGGPWIQFWLNGPNDPSCQAGSAIFYSAEIPYSTSTGKVSFAVSSSQKVYDQTLSHPAWVSSWNPSWDMTPGTYRWVVDYYYWDTSTNSMQLLESNCNAEEVTVSAPAIATQASPSSGPTTGTFSDTAQITDVPQTSPAATVNFNLYSGSTSSSCTGTPVYSSGPEAITMSGQNGTATSGSVSLNSGPYEWQAVLNWAGSSLKSQCGTEDVTAAGTPSITTVPVPATAVVGSKPLSDTAQITGLYDPQPADSVDFALYQPTSGEVPQDCGTLVKDFGNSPIGSSTMVNGVPTWSVASNGSYMVPTVGTYYWEVTFNSVQDPFNTSTSFCGEPVTISQTTPQIVTTPSAGGPVGTSLSDGAAVTGLVNPSSSDTVDFSLYSDSSCTVLVKDLGTGSLSGPTSVGGVDTWSASSPGAGFAPTTSGKYYWGVSFISSNDPNNPSSSAPVCGEEVTLTAAGGVLGASTSTPGTGADLLIPGLLASLALLLGGLLLTVGLRLRRRPLA